MLRDGQPTAWQRQFFADMRAKIDRYGTRTRLSEKQLGLLRRLTRIEGTTDGIVLSMGRYHAPQDPKHNRRRTTSRKWRYRDLQWLALVVAIAVVYVGHLFQSAVQWSAISGTPSPFPQSSFTEQRFTVTDGDTIRMADGTAVRLVGFDTPETFQPMCAREAELGNRASERLRQLVAAGTSTVTKVACACAPGTEGTERCNFGRRCAILRVDGKDVAQTLISEGLAVSFQCGLTQCPRLPRPWCS